MPVNNKELLRMRALLGGGSSGGGGDTADTSFKDVIERTAVNPTLPSDLKEIGGYAFADCNSLALTSLPAAVTIIKQYAFNSCHSLALTSLPASLTNLGQNCFNNCGRLALTSLPDGLTSVPHYAFANCSSLAIKSIPASVTLLGNSAFSGCSSLTEITFKGKPSGGIKTTSFGSCTNLLTINVPWAEGEVENAPWGATKATINYNYTGG